MFKIQFMKKNLPALLITAFTALIIIGLAVLALKQSPSASSTTNANAPTVGSDAINFSLQGLDGTTYSLSQYKEKEPVFLEFFAVWCPHCQRMAPIVEQLNQKYGSKIQFLNVQASPYGKNYETQGDTTPATSSDLNWFKDNFGIKYPILADQSTTTANKYGVQGFPTFFVIDRTGKIIYTSSGEVPQATLYSAINKVITK